MKAKQFILMLLVMLMSATGAWSEIVNKSYKFDYTTCKGSMIFDDNIGAKFAQLRIAVCGHEDDYVQISLEFDDYYDIYSSWTRRTSNIEYDDFEVLGISATHATIKVKDPAVTLISAKTDYATYYPDADNNEIKFDYNGGALCFKSITVNYTIVPHTHIIGEWSHNDTQHWHVCSGTGVACPNNKILDRANHDYNVNITDDSQVYTCTVCGYVNETVKSQYDAREYLSMKAVGGNVTIGMTKTGSPADYDLQYSSDRIHWTSVALTATNNNIVEIVSGTTCYFRQGTETASDRISASGDNCWTFTMTGTGTIESSGNIMSLLDITTHKTDVGSYAFVNLFKGCDKLTKAPKLPATSTSERCYMGMFEGAGIAEAPALIANRVENGAYQNMFRNCLNLETVPELVATQVDEAGYMDMFNGCKKIKEITLGDIATIEDGNAFQRWLDGTAYGAEGIIIAPDAMVANANIPLPGNWMYKQIRDYTTAVSNALVGAAEMIQNIGKDYILQITQAPSNASALSLRDEALNGINLLKKYNSQIEAGQFYQPSGAGMRLKITKKDGKVYEFRAKDIESTEYYRATE